MENATLIMLIVSLILLSGISFLIFQTWLSIKEIKITVPKMFEDLKSYDVTLKETILNTKIAHNENISSVANSLTSKINEQFENTKNAISSFENKIISEQNKLKEDVEGTLEEVQGNIQKIKETFSKELAPLIIQINSNNEKVIEKIRSMEQNFKNEVDKLHKAITEPLDL